MEYRFCGHSGLMLPAVSLGLWHNFGDVDSLDNARKIALRAFDLGITHFDLANNYGPSPGSAESNFGIILRDNLASHRDEIIVTSKAGHLMWPGPYGDGSSRKYIMASIDQSLRRTGLDYFDIFYSHRYCPETPWQETAQTLVDIVRAGKALYVGISKYPVEIARKVSAYLEQRDVHCLVYQDKYNLLTRNLEKEHFNWLADDGIGFVAFSPLAQGLLTNRYLNGIPADSRAAKSTGYLKQEEVTPELVAKISRLNDLASKRGQSLAEMSLAWLLRNKAVTSVIVGASSVAQLEDNVKAIDSPEFTADELNLIDSILA